jgi:hypothetical protein
VPVKIIGVSSPALAYASFRLPTNPTLLRNKRKGVKEMDA